jgi:hypothetical protein
MEGLSHRALTLVVLASVAITAAGFALLRRAPRRTEM